MIRSVIFDWSGVLSDDWQATFETANDILEARGIGRISMERFAELFDLPWVNFYKNMGIEVDAGEEQALWSRLFPKHYGLLKPRAGARETLEWLKKRKVKTLVLSSHNHDLLVEEIEQYGFGELIDAASGSNHKKGEKIKAFIKAHNVRRESALFVGDMCHDIETARKAKIKSVAVLGGYEKRERLEKEKPDFAIESVGELPRLIRKIEGKQ
jgi:phosphoglycolate phosphatase